MLARLLPVYEITGGSYEIFYTRKYIAILRTLEKRFPASFSKASRKKKKESWGGKKKEKHASKLPPHFATVRYENFGGASIHTP